MSNSTLPDYEYDDGGRADAGYKGHTGDCGIRAVAIATGKPYREVYKALIDLSRNWPGRSKRAKAIREKSSPRRGLFHEVLTAYLESLGWRERKSHLRIDQLHQVEGATKAAVLKVRKHFVACVDGVIRDTYDSRMTSGDFTDGIPQPKVVTRIWMQA